MFEPVKVAFGEYMTRFYYSLAPTTRSMHEYVNRGVGKSIAWAPSRMVDQAEEMLASWQRNDTDQAATQPAKLPVIVVAMAKDYMPAGRDFTRQAAESRWIIMPEDPKERAFGVKTIAADIRTQLAIFAQDEPTARSIAAQFCLFIDSMENRRFRAWYEFAGFKTDWPVQLESPDTPAGSVASGSKNVSIVTIDLTFKATVPLFDAPKEGEPNDGKGVPGTNDPAGYPVVVEVDTTREWAA